MRTFSIVQLLKQIPRICMFHFRRGDAGGVWGRSDGAVPLGNELDPTDRMSGRGGGVQSCSSQRLIPQRTGDYTETQMPWTWRNGYGFLGYAYIFACTTTNQPKCISILDSSDMHGFFFVQSISGYPDIHVRGVSLSLKGFIDVGLARICDIQSVPSLRYRRVRRESRQTLGKI